MSWPKVKLGALCDTKSGGTPRRGNSEYYSGEIPWVKIGDLDAQNGVILDTDEKITEAGLASIGNRIFEKGTILLSMYGSVGKVAIAGRKLAINQAILGLKIKDEKLLNPRFRSLAQNNSERIDPLCKGRNPPEYQSKDGKRC